MKLPRNAQLWLPGYLQSRLHRGSPDPAKGPVRVWLAITDHYEPFWNEADLTLARQRVALWSEKWPEIAKRHVDSAGRHPQYSFFYPQEEYEQGILDALTAIKESGIGDVEIHIHHDGEGRQNFLDRMNGFIEVLTQKHGLLRRRDGQVVFGFIHGMWALDNSRPDGRWCGLNDELTILRDLGCYADFTMPSGNSPTQARMVNTIYWAKDDPLRPKSYDTGKPVRVGDAGNGDLLMITGPLAVRWKERLLPRLESGEIAGQDPPTEYRFRLWLEVAPRIGNDIFIKLHTHGAQEKNSSVLLGGGLDRLFTAAAKVCQERGYELHFASAWNMYLAVTNACLQTNGTSKSLHS